MKILVDADALAYTCGFAAQRTVYDWTTVLNGEVVGEGIVTTKEELEATELMMPEGASLHVSPVIDAEPLVNALAMCKRTLLNIETVMDEHKFYFDRLHLFLTGSGNFREKLATIRGYKANRVGMERPVHYHAIRRYMTERWKAVTVEGYEADDAVAMEAFNHNYSPELVCIVSMDKDLKTVPGRLYNFRKREMRVITPDEALRHFYRQMLTGDVVDNILGCFKAGDKRAMDLIPDDLTDEQEMYRRVLEEFRASMARKGCPYTHMSAENVVLETGRLLHMQRYVGDMWSPPSG